MPYKKSRFNFTYRQSEDAYVVFNTYSKALVVLSSAASVIKTFEGGELNEGYPESKDYTKDFHTPC